MKASAMLIKAVHSLSGSKVKGSIVTNAGWLFAEKVIRMVVGLFVGVWLARYLGVAQFGLLSYAIAFASLFTAIASLGLNRITVRELVRHKERKGIILGSVFSMKLAGGCLALILAVSIIWLLQPGDTTTRWLVAIIAAGMIFQSADAFDFWFQAKMQSRYAVMAKSSATAPAMVSAVSSIRDPAWRSGPTTNSLPVM